MKVDLIKANMIIVDIFDSSWPSQPCNLTAFQSLDLTGHTLFNRLDTSGREIPHCWGLEKLHPAGPEMERHLTNWRKPEAFLSVLVLGRPCEILAQYSLIEAPLKWKPKEIIVEKRWAVICWPSLTNQRWIQYGAPTKAVLCTPHSPCVTFSQFPCLFQVGGLVGSSFPWLWVANARERMSHVNATSPRLGAKI